MQIISVAETKAHLSEVLSLVEAGEDVMISRRGKPIARLTSIEQPLRPIDFRKLEAFRASLPKLSSSTELLRKLRDEGY